MIEFFFDFETRSHADLKKVGAVKYAHDPTTEATLLIYAFSDGPIKVWQYGDQLSQELMEVFKQPEKFKFIAHNILFDYLIWNVVCRRQFGVNFPEIPIKSIEDNMMLSQYARMGSSLDGVAVMFDLPVEKDKEGRRIMLKQTKPNSRTKKYPVLTEQEQADFIRYGKMDVEILRRTYRLLPQLPFTERWGFEWTFKRNITGIKVDIDLLCVMRNILDIEIPKLSKEFEHIVGYKFKVNQRAKVLEWFRHYYPHMENMQKSTVRDTLAGDYPAPDHVRRALEIKQEVGSTSLAKVPTAMERVHNGRIYELLNFLKAHTRRWAGMGIQIQNFPRPDKIDYLGDLNVKGLAKRVREAYWMQENGCSYIKSLLRRIWLPDEGKTFYCGDFSKIEPTVLFWLTGLGPIPKLWYEEMAAEIYGCDVKDIGSDSEERQLGKNTNLGCGYGMGPPKFRKQIHEQSGKLLSEELCIRAVQAYRRKYWQVVEFWKHLEWGFRKAIQGQGSVLCNGKVHILPMRKLNGDHTDGVKIRLPSGSFLFYPNAKIYDSGMAYDSVLSATKVKEKIYGGLLCEHVVSAISRDLMLGSLYHLNNAGFDCLNVVHDEIWAQAESGRDEEFEKTMCHIPRWCSDMIVKVESKNGVRYLK